MNISRTIEISCALLIAAGFLAPANAAAIHPDAGTTSAAFLKLGMGSRAAGMGNAFAALCDDGTAIYWNPAGLAWLDRREFAFSHRTSFEGIQNDFISYAYPFQRFNFAAALYGLYTPEDLERRSGLNESDPFEPLSPSEGTFRAYDMAVHVAGALKVRPDLSLGLGLKVIRQTIDTYSAGTYAGDLGALYRPESLPLSLALVVQHLGDPVKFRYRSYPLPLNVKLGSAYRWNEKTVTTLDLNQPVDDYLLISAGTEYLPLRFLAIRAGYTYRVNGLELGDLSGISCGLGFNFNFRDTRIGIDYSLQPAGDLGSTQYFSLRMNFAMPRPAVVFHPVEMPQTAASAPRLSTAPASAVDLSPAPATPARAYAFFTSPITTKMKTASARLTMYEARASFTGSTLLLFEGTVRQKARPASVVKLGEAPGTARVYRYFTFETEPIKPVLKPSIRIKLPLEINAPVVKLETGAAVTPEQYDQDGIFRYFKFSLDYLQPFSVEDSSQP